MEQARWRALDVALGGCIVVGVVVLLGALSVVGYLDVARRRVQR